MGNAGVVRGDPWRSEVAAVRRAGILRCYTVSSPDTGKDREDQILIVRLHLKERYGNGGRRV